jgi:hypothetical protein
MEGRLSDTVFMPTRDQWVEACRRIAELERDNAQLVALVDSLGGDEPDKPVAVAADAAENEQRTDRG